MAVEVKRNTKGLHKHSSPIALLGIAGLAFSILLFSQYGANGSGQNGVMRKALVSRVFQVTPTKNGLAHIQKYQRTVATNQSIKTAPLKNITENIGEVTTLDVTVQASSSVNAK